MFFPIYIQLTQSYRLSELKATGVQISSTAQGYIDFTGHTVSDGLPQFTPEPAAIIFLATFAIMIIAGTWVNLSKD